MNIVALELLYGPVDITVNGMPVTSASGFMWMQGIGLLAVLDAGAFGFYAVQLDGQAEGPRSSYNGGGPVLDLRGSRSLAMATVNDLYNFNYLAGMPDTVSFLHGSSVLFITVITADRYLAFRDTGSSVQALYTHDGTTYTAEYTFPFHGSLVSVSRGRSMTEVCLVFSGGQICFYDVSLKTQNGPTLFAGEDPDGCWYVPKYDIFVEVKSLQVKILADAAQPYSISIPTATPAVDAGLVSQLQVQLLGAQSEPCVGEMINWSITAGSGSLIKPQSTTDNNGYATNALVIPVGSTGSTSVSATLSY
jgi:hypothetical protein